MEPLIHSGRMALTTARPCPWAPGATGSVPGAALFRGGRIGPEAPVIFPQTPIRTLEKGRAATTLRHRGSSRDVLRWRVARGLAPVGGESLPPPSVRA